MTEHTSHLHRPIITFARKDVAKLHKDLTVQTALDKIREKKGMGDRIVYFYVVDSNDRLVGVVPTRRLLGSQLEQRLSEVMIGPVITIPKDASVLDAYEFFMVHKLLAFPVVDEHKHILGVVDVGMFTDEAFDVADQTSMDRVFETIGFRLMQVRDVSPLRAFRFRFPWLLATITSGTICALLAGVYEMTLAKSLILAFFLTLVLGLGESVSMQSMTVTIQGLRSEIPTLGWYLRTLRREVGAALLLGTACGLIVSVIAWIWRGDPLASVTIGSSILLTLCAASFFGLSVPSLLHKVKLDLKIAAGPVTLAMTDISTLLIYFSIAEALL
ncbi:magnesium transporter [Desulfococcus multivorans]|nr:magnesium transporter [Desulfococcus multivorans]AOY57476.1 MgtE1: predicted magnesium transporter [Desulfococcus multivorans]AQU99909.1 magnesium transporter MgtE [Desulfococcus multivorans]